MGEKVWVMDAYEISLNPLVLGVWSGLYCRVGRGGAGWKLGQPRSVVLLMLPGGRKGGGGGCSGSRSGAWTLGMVGVKV